MVLVSQTNTKTFGYGNLLRKSGGPSELVIQTTKLPGLFFPSVIPGLLIVYTLLDWGSELSSQQRFLRTTTVSVSGVFAAAFRFWCLEQRS